jgi:hypothetical protein
MRAIGLLAFLTLAGCFGSDGPACDSSPGTLGGTCVTSAAGQCVDFAKLGTTDLASVKRNCTNLGGTWSDTACPTAQRIGTCTIPPTDPRSAITCSPDATLQLRYYPPQYDLAKAMTACAGAAGTTFTPN